MMHGSDTDGVVHLGRGWKVTAWAMLVIVALGAGVFSAIRKDDQSVRAISEKTRETLDDLVIPEFKLHEATLDEAIAHLNLAIAERGLSQKLHVERWLSVEPPNGFLRFEGAALASIPATPNPERLPNGTSAELQQSKEEVRRSFLLENVPLTSALRHVSSHFGCTTGERGSTILLIPGYGAFGPLLRRTFRVHSPERFGAAGSGGVIDAKTYFLFNNVTFYEGTYAYVLPNGTLVASNVREEIERIEAAIQNPPERSIFERIKRWIMGSWEQMRTQFSAP